jgi:EAL domain-containing protein (putative c-di-GMP-specific phosphodiesterase class I)
VINDTHIAPQSLDIEITESILMKNIQENIKLVQELSKLGVKFSLDDFGTGYSSLSYLRLFKFNYLKIDQSFIREITTKKENIPIVTAIIALANNLGLSTIAEGVETNEQLDILKMLNCDLYQGYLFSKPVPQDEFKKLLIENKKQFSG